MAELFRDRRKKKLEQPRTGGRRQLTSAQVRTPERTGMTGDDLAREKRDLTTLNEAPKREGLFRERRAAALSGETPVSRTGAAPVSTPPVPTIEAPRVIGPDPNETEADRLRRLGDVDIRSAEDDLSLGERQETRRQLQVRGSIAGLKDPLELEKGQRLLRSQEAQKKEQGFQQALAGTARGSRAQERNVLLQDLQKQQQEAVTAEENARRTFIVRQAEGESAQRLRELAEKLNVSKDRRLQIEQDIFNAEENSRLAAQSDEAALARQEAGDKAALSKQIQQQEFDTKKAQSDFILDQAASLGKEFFDGLSAEDARQIQSTTGMSIPVLRSVSSQLSANGDASNEFTFTAPNVDDFGNVLTPGYIFNKGNGTFETINPVTGTQTTILSGPQAQNAAVAFKNFDDYASKLGNGNVVEGSPYHKGFEVDIDGKIGDPIPSYAGGKVVQVTPEAESGGFGNTVVVDTNGIKIRYAHLDEMFVQPGQTIGAGEQLGTMGNTGNVIPLGEGDGSHLHIEARDAQNNLVDLGKIPSASTLTQQTSPINAIRGEGMSKGYITNSEQLAYVDAKRAGITLPDKINELSLDKKVSTAKDLRKEFDTETKTARTALNQVQLMNDSLDLLMDQAEEGILNPATQGILVTFQKILDPTSVVRESEYARSGEGLALMDRMQGKYIQWTEGGAGVTPESLKDFVTMANTWAKGYKDSIADIGQRTKYIADQYDLDDNLIFTPSSRKLLEESNRGSVVDQDIEFLQGTMNIESDDFDAFFDEL